MPVQFAGRVYSANTLNIEDGSIEFELRAMSIGSGPLAMRCYASDEDAQQIAALLENGIRSLSVHGDYACTEMGDEIMTNCRLA